jgi:hypothetical protein
MKLLQQLLSLGSLCHVIYLQLNCLGLSKPLFGSGKGVLGQPHSGHSKRVRAFVIPCLVLLVSLDLLRFILILVFFLLDGILAKSEKNRSLM